MYKENKLKEYIDNSIKFSITDNFKVRCSQELLKKYNQELYEEALLNLKECIDEIMSLNLIYPANAKPILFLTTTFKNC